MKNNKLKNNLLFKNIKDMNTKVLVILSIGVFATVFLTSYALFTTQVEGNKSLELTYNPNYEFTQSFSYTGNYEEFEVPKSGYYYIEASGAQGGLKDEASPFARGGFTSGYVYLTKGEKLYIYVGGKGTLGVGGYNGGGTPGTLTTAGFGGGGATDIRYFGDKTPSSTDLQWNSTFGLNSRIMVAAGGGGVAYNRDTSDSGNYNSNGTNHGGGLIGQNAGYYSDHGNSSQYGKGGRQTYYENAGLGIFGGTTTNSGEFGIGASGSGESSSAGVGGGGSGYYGGGAGGNTLSGGTGHGGGGGSSFISGYAGVNAITSSTDRTHTNNTLHYSGKYFLNGKMIAGANDGNGNAKITYVERKLERRNTNLDDVRYIKDCINGSSANVSNHWVELQAVVNGENVALNKEVAGTSTESSYYSFSNIVNGLVDNSYGEHETATGEQCIIVDLDTTYDLDEVAVWHYYEDGRSYNSHSLYVSSNNSSWTTLIDNESGVAETSEGKRVTAYGDSYILTNLIPNSSMENTGWTCPYSSEISRYGDYSCKLTGTTSTVEQYATLSSTITLDNTHKYYGRVEAFTTAVSGESVDIFWPISGEGYFGSVEILQPNQWDVYGLIVDRTNIANGSHGLRLDYNNNYLTNTAYYDGAMLIDLTETFGAGNEPTVEWCNENIPYFNGKARINVTK